MDGRLNAGLSTAGVDDDVGTRAELALLDHVLCVLFRADSSALEAGRSRVVECELQTLLVDINSHNLGRAIGLCNSTAEQANGASTEYDDRISGLDASLPCDVHGNSCGLDQCALLERHALGQLVAVVLGQCVVPCQRAVVGRGRGKSHVRAEVILALFAADTHAAGHAGLHGDGVAYFQGGDLVADGVNDTRGLVAEHHGRLDDEVSDASLDPVVDVGTADARPSRLDDDIVWGGEFWDGAVLVLYFSWGFEHEGGILHNLISSCLSEIQIDLLYVVAASGTLVASWRQHGGAMVGQASHLLRGGLCRHCGGLFDFQFL